MLKVKHISTAKTYRAFISYSHGDKAFASWLQKKIEGYVVPRALRRKYPHLPKDLKRSIFRDEEELAGAKALTPALEEALRASQKLIVICTKSAAYSTWVSREIAFFRRAHPQSDIVCVAIDEADDETIPDLLKENGELPLAITLHEGRKKALTKVIADLLDIPFSDLWDRERRRKRIRMLLWGAGIASVAALGVYAYVQYSVIASNRDMQRLNERISHIEYRLRHEKLSGEEIYRLGERLKVIKDAKRAKEETLKWFGLLHTPIVERAKRLYDKEGIDAALALLESSRSRLQDKQFAQKNILRAKLYIEKHDYDVAEAAYEKAIAIEESYETIYDYALFLMRENRTKRALALLEKLRSYDLKPVWRANVLNRLGIAYRKLKRYEDAQKAYAEALRLRKHLAQKDPVDLAWTYNNLGVLYQKRHMPHKAEAMHFKAFEIRKALASADPERYEYYLTCTTHNLGELYADMNRSTDAERYFKEAIEIQNRLLARNPKRVMPALATSLYDLATLYADRNDTHRARMLFKEALRYRTILAEENPPAYEEALKKTQKALEKLQTGAE